MKTTLALLFSLALGTAFVGAEEAKPATPPADLKPKPAPEGAKVYIISPKDGKTVKSPVLVRFGLKGMGVAPAGVDIPNTGHHHLLVDGPKVDLTLPLPMSEQVRHFGGGQTEAEIELPAGEHTLQLVVGDLFHVPHNPPVASEVITIKVEE